MGILDKILKKRRENNTPIGSIVPGNDEQRELYNRSRGKKHKEPEEEYK